TLSCVGRHDCIGEARVAAVSRTGDKGAGAAVAAAVAVVGSRRGAGYLSIDRARWHLATSAPNPIHEPCVEHPATFQFAEGRPFELSYSANQGTGSGFHH